MGIIAKFFFIALIYIFVEVCIFVEVAFKIGFFYAFLLLIGFSIIGYIISKKIKSNSFQNSLIDFSNGKSPSKNLLKTASFFIAGLLFLMPGFLTDALAVLFLIPFLNYFLLYLIFKYFKNKFKNSFSYYGPNNTYAEDEEALKKNFIIFRKF